jgi:hypothetical protein
LKFRLLLLTVFLSLVTSGAQGGLFKNSVDLADLSEVPPETLDMKAAQAELKAAKANQDDARSRQREYDSASRKARDKAGKLGQLESDWNRLAKNVGFTATE